LQPRLRKQVEIDIGILSKGVDIIPNELLKLVLEVGVSMRRFWVRIETKPKISVSSFLNPMRSVSKQFWFSVS